MLVSTRPKEQTPHGRRRQTKQETGFAAGRCAAFREARRRQAGFWREAISPGTPHSKKPFAKHRDEAAGAGGERPKRDFKASGAGKPGGGFKSGGSKPYAKRADGDQRSFGDRPARSFVKRERPDGDKPFRKPDREGADQRPGRRERDGVPAAARRVAPANNDRQGHVMKAGRSARTSHSAESRRGPNRSPRVRRALPLHAFPTRRVRCSPSASPSGWRAPASPRAATPRR